MRKASLGQLFVAVQLLDVAWSSLMLMGVEKVKLVPGFLPASPLNLYDMPSQPIDHLLQA